MGGDSLADQLFGAEVKLANLRARLAGPLTFDEKREIIEHWVHRVLVSRGLKFKSEEGEVFEEPVVVPSISITYTFEEMIWPSQTMDKVRKGELKLEDVVLPSITDLEKT